MILSECYSNSTTCVFSGDIKAIKNLIVDLFSREGGKQISQLPDSMNELDRDEFWIVGLFPAKNNWTIIKTWSSELLCVKNAKDCKPKLSTLSMKLGCDAFYLFVDQGFGGILLETNATGDFHISGCYHSTTEIGIEINTFYELPIHKPGLIENFSLLKVSKKLEIAVKINQYPSILLIEEDEPYCQNYKYIDSSAFIHGYEYMDEEFIKENIKGHTQNIDEAFYSVIDSSGIWAFPSLPYIIYKDSRVLSVANGHLLYFQTPNDYKAPYAFELTPQPIKKVYEG